MALGPTVRLWLPTINFFIAIGALGFQTTMLYPWHHELDRQFKSLKDEQRSMLKEYHEVRLKRFMDLEQRVFDVETKQHKVGPLDK